MSRKIERDNHDSRQVYSSARPAGYDEEDVFGNEEAHDIRYKTLSWPMVAVLMIDKIADATLGMLSLPSSLAVVYVYPCKCGRQQQHRRCFADLELLFLTVVSFLV
jgi:hypothetical protein